MDDSQSSDVFSNNTVDSGANVPAFMDITTYQTLQSTTKAALSRNFEDVVQRGGAFEAFFASIVEDCYSCVNQSLGIITSSLGDAVQCSSLSELVEDLAVLLQLMSSFLRKTIEVSISCRALRGFPVTTGQILAMVFTHCKLSTSVYGDHLSSLQKELKDLFRCCHELQLVYLTILEKHFLFDLTEDGERKVLLEALHINLTIGEIVEMLDLKTTAEQWKFYAAFCEKYSSGLQDTCVFENCANTLSGMILRNVNSSLEENQDDKVVLRSLKVSNFIMKILMKMCHIFKNTSVRGHETIVTLLINIYVNNASYMLYKRKAPQLIQMMNSNVLTAADSLVSELVAHRGFARAFLYYDVDRIHKEDALLGYMILVSTVMRSLVHRNNSSDVLWMETREANMISCVFRLVPLCHTWFNLPLRLSSASPQHHSQGLYEHLLAQAVCYSATVDGDQYCWLEESLYEAVLGSDCWGAVFANDLWVVLAGMGNPELRVSQLIYLCQSYHKLERLKHFQNSPQKVHLSRLIESMFQSLEKDEKSRVYQHFAIDGDFGSIWVLLKIKRLPGDQQKQAEAFAIDKVKSYLGKLISRSITRKEIGSLIKSMELASTCSFMRMDYMEDVISAWLQACPKSGRMTSLMGDLCSNNQWFLEYLTALVSLTETMAPLLQRNSEGLMKVLHVTSGIISTGNLESKLISLNIIFKLALYNPDNLYKSRIDAIYYEIFKSMLRETNATFRNKLFENIRTYHNMRIKDLIAKVVIEDPVLDEMWNEFQRSGVLGRSKMSWKDQLQIVSEFGFSHKCLHTNSDIIELTDSESSSDIKIVERIDSSNFEFADVDSLFNNATETEQPPASKKAKLEHNEIEQIIHSMETNIAQLEKLKENLNMRDYRNRITSACENLKNIIN